MRMHVFYYVSDKGKRAREKERDGEGGVCEKERNSKNERGEKGAREERLVSS